MKMDANNMLDFRPDNPQYWTHYLQGSPLGISRVATGQGHEFMTKFMAFLVKNSWFFLQNHGIFLKIHVWNFVLDILQPSNNTRPLTKTKRIPEITYILLRVSSKFQDWRHIHNTHAYPTLGLPKPWWYPHLHPNWDLFLGAWSFLFQDWPIQGRHLPLLTHEDSFSYIQTKKSSIYIGLLWTQPGPGVLPSGLELCFPSHWFLVFKYSVNGKSKILT